MFSIQKNKIKIRIINLDKDDLARMQSQAAMPCLSTTYSQPGWVSYLWDWFRR